jgi:hypothetical protein
VDFFRANRECKEYFSGADPAFDVSSWVRGEEYPVTSIVGLPGKLEPGIYDLRIALTTEAGKPASRLPIEGEDGIGRYRLGTIRLLQGNAK